MRWFWFDRYTEFVSGTRATAIKNVSLSEEHVHDHFPGVPMMPDSLVIEGLAQTGGVVCCKYHCSAYGPGAGGSRKPSTLTICLPAGSTCASNAGFDCHLAGHSKKSDCSRC